MRHGNLISVKARIEVKAVDQASGKIVAIDRQTTVAVDLAEQIAAKNALQEAGAVLAERLLPKIVTPEDAKRGGEVTLPPISRSPGKGAAMRIPAAIHCAILAAGLVAGCSERPPTADRPASEAAKLASHPTSAPSSKPPSKPTSVPSAKPPSRPHAIGPVKLSFRRWAVICSKDVQQAGLGDLVTAELSKEKDLELVDRDQLDAVTKELELAAVLESQAAAARLKMGQVLKADALLLLSIEGREKGRLLKVVVNGEPACCC